MRAHAGPARRGSRGRRWMAAAVALSLFTVSACGSGSSTSSGASAPPSSASPTSPTTAANTPPAVTTSSPSAPAVPLRAGESFLQIGIAQKYTPHADKGTDDYHCFLVDPKLVSDKFLTGIAFEPDQAKEVHHAILYRIEPSQVAAAKAQNAQSGGQGWSCFGGAGMSVSVAGTGNSAGNALAELNSAPWLSAWAPGGREQLYANNIGVPLAAGSMIVLQVHYNLRAGATPDQTKVRLRLAPGTAALKPLTTMLLPAPVELPCATGETGPLCDRTQSLIDLGQRFGNGAGATVAGLQFLCGGNVFHPVESPTQHCDRRVDSAVTIQAAAGHMHLLGKSMSIVLDPDTPNAQMILNIPVWDFDNQGAKPLLHPITVEPGHTIRVTCTHDASLREKLPALKDLPARYVTWGDGSTDEMCLGVLLVTK